MGTTARDELKARIETLTRDKARLEAAAESLSGEVDRTHARLGEVLRLLAEYTELLGEKP